MVDQITLANIVGSILSLRWTPGDAWMDRLFTVAGGLAVSFFIAPWATDQLKITSDKGLVAAGFIFGLLGANLIVKFVIYIKGLEMQAILDVLRGKRP